MNVVGRQMSRSNSSSHHQRQYSDHLIDASSKWLQSSTSLSQDFGFYGGGVQGSRMSRNIVDPPTPLGSRSMSLRRNGDDRVSPTSEFSPGLLDLHSFDTELLPEMPVPSLYGGSQLHQPLQPLHNNVAKIKVVVCLFDTVNQNASVTLYCVVNGSFDSLDNCNTI
nr:kinesin-like protein kin-13b [Quercus suber]